MKRCVILIASVFLAGAAGCGKKADTPVAVSPPAPAQPTQPSPKDDTTGTVKFILKADDTTAVVSIDGNDYLAKELAEAISLPAGEHALILKISGTEVKNQRFTVVKGKRLVLEVAEPNREAAEWVLRIGGRLRIAVAGKEVEVKAPADLPRSDFPVTFIDASSRKFSEADLVRLEGLTHLHYFGARWMPLPGNILSHVRGLKALREVSVEGTKVDDAALENLKNLPNLVCVRLDGTQITDAGLAHLQGLDLTGINLGGTKVTGAGLASLSKMANLDAIWANKSKIGDAGLEHLKGLGKLKHLGLAGTAVTDAGLVHLKNLKTLTVLQLEKTQVTNAGLADLKAALPQCKITSDYGTFGPKKESS